MVLNVISQSGWVVSKWRGSNNSLIIFRRGAGRSLSRISSTLLIKARVNAFRGPTAKSTISPGPNLGLWIRIVVVFLPERMSSQYFFLNHIFINSILYGV